MPKIAQNCQNSLKKPKLSKFTEKAKIAKNRQKSAKKPKIYKNQSLF
jgi:hypothetical protein